MYSVVLMTALTTGVDLPDFGRRGGCYGGCYGGRRHGCCGCYGGCYGCYGGCFGCYGGCFGCFGCYGGVVYYGCHGCYGGTQMPYHHQPAPEKAPAPKEKKSQLDAATPATLVVELPADAKLLIDNEATVSTGANRIFQSPALAPEREYQYTLRAEVVRNGKPIKAEQVVTVKAGEITTVKLTLPPAGVAQH